MALTDDNFNVSMPVAPAYGMGGYAGQGGFGFGGDSLLWVILILCLGGGWGGFGGFGMGAGMMGAGMWGMDMLYPWLNNSQNINDGFRDQQLSTQISGIQNAVTSGFGDTALGIAGINQNICQTGNGISAAIFGAQSAISQQMNASDLAAMNRSFAEQTANAQGFTGVQAGLADTKYTIATEECATRSAAAMNARDIIDSQTRGTQAILDKLCALELDGVKNQLAQAQRENVALQNAVNMATMQASQVAQTAEIRAAQATTANQLVSELRSCPIPAQPVYGNQPIFTCGGANYSGCGCGGVA